MKIQQHISLSTNTHVAPQVHEPMPITWVEIDHYALAHNVQQYKSLVGNALFAAVIKSNAYGHGIAQIASLLEHNNNVDFLCVVSLREAVYLRSIDIKKPLLVLSIIDDDMHKAALYDIAVILFDITTAHALNEAGKKLHKKISVHVKVDTGLNRLGLLVQEVVPFIKKINQLPFLNIQGIFTHFAYAESDDQTYTQYQITRFTHVLDEIAALGIHIPLRHASCSAAITANFDSHFTMVRAGIGVYGLWPSQENKQITGVYVPTFSLKPVLSWKTTIIHVKEIPAGSYVGYDLTYKTTKTTRIATLPIGYWDGYERKLSNKGFVFINNQLAPIVGKIAMNLMMVDCTNIHACVGDQVTLLGNFPGITADDFASQCSTINYQVVTNINPLLPRIVV